MVRKKEMTAAVSGLKEQMSEGPQKNTPEKAETDKNSSQEPPVEPPKTPGSDTHPQLKEVERLLEEHGVDAEELKGLVEKFLNELRDLPEEKPLVALVGAFLLGFLAGRAGRK